MEESIFKRVFDRLEKLKKDIHRKKGIKNTDILEVHTHTPDDLRRRMKTIDEQAESALTELYITENFGTNNNAEEVKEGRSQYRRYQIESGDIKDAINTREKTTGDNIIQGVRQFLPGLIKGLLKPGNENE